MFKDSTRNFWKRNPHVMSRSMNVSAEEFNETWGLFNVSCFSFARRFAEELTFCNSNQTNQAKQ